MSPLGAPLAALPAVGVLLAASDGSGARPGSPVVLPLTVSVPAAGRYALSLGPPPATVEGRQVTVDLLDGGQPVALPFAFDAAAGNQAARFALRVRVAPGTPSEDGPAAVDAVGPVYPNPTAGPATVEVTVSTAQTVRVSVVDALGREVRVTFDDQMSAGAAVRVRLPAGLAPEAYAVVVRGATVLQPRRLTVLR